MSSRLRIDIGERRAVIEPISPVVDLPNPWDHPAAPVHAVVVPYLIGARSVPWNRIGKRSQRQCRYGSAGGRQHSAQRLINRRHRARWRQLLLCARLGHREYRSGKQGGRKETTWHGEPPISWNVSRLRFSIVASCTIRSSVSLAVRKKMGEPLRRSRQIHHNRFTSPKRKRETSPKRKRGDRVPLACASGWHATHLPSPRVR